MIRVLDNATIESILQGIKRWAKELFVNDVTYEDGKLWKWKYRYNGSQKYKEEIAEVVTWDDVGVPNGVCPLNESGTVDPQYLPGYVDDIIEAYAIPTVEPLTEHWLSEDPQGAHVIEPSTGKIYILMEDAYYGGELVYNANTQFRWNGSSYVKLSDGDMIPITNAEIDEITSH